MCLFLDTRRRWKKKSITYKLEREIFETVTNHWCYLTDDMKTNGDCDETGMKCNTCLCLLVEVISLLIHGGIVKITNDYSLRQWLILYASN